MKTPTPIQFDQRPSHYWDDAEVLAELLRPIEDAAKRNLITKLWTNGDTEKLESELDLDDGGELPTCMPWEKEIAIIILDSVNHDRISVRAIKLGKWICYKVVDISESRFKLHRKGSDRPLSLQELIDFLDHTSLDGLPGGISLGYNLMNAEYSEKTELRHFTSIVSRFYPELNRYYEQVFEDWVNTDDDSLLND